MGESESSLLCVAECPPRVGANLDVADIAMHDGRYARTATRDTHEGGGSLGLNGLLNVQILFESSGGVLSPGW